jgi:amino acid transporter
VTLSCSGAPAASTCSISPTQLNLDGNDPAIASVMITTAARSFLPPIAQRRFDPPLLLVKQLARFFAYLLVCAVVWRLVRIPRKRLFLTAAVALPIALLCASCGASSSSVSTNPPPTQPGGTPQGAFTITVSVTSANLSHTTNVMLRVN